MIPVYIVGTAQEVAVMVRLVSHIDIYISHYHSNFL